MTNREWAWGVLGALASNALPVLALAQDTTGDRPTSFQAGGHEDIPGGTLLVVAYAIVLFLLAAYVVYLTAMQQSAAKELTRLEGLLTKKKD